MKIKKITAIFVGVLIAAIIIYDVYAILVGGTEATISWLMIDWSYKYPVFPFILGMLAGHLTWRMPGYDKYIERKNDK